MTRTFKCPKCSKTTKGLGVEAWCSSCPKQPAKTGGKDPVRMVQVDTASA